MKSIRAHLSVSLICGSTLLAGACGWLVHHRMSRALLAQFDRALVSQARALGGLLEPEIFGVEFAFDPARMPEYSRAERPELFQVWLANGTVLRRSPSLGDADLPRRCGTPEQPEVFSLELPAGTPGRAAGVRVIVAGEEDKIRADPALAAAAAQLELGSGGIVDVVVARDTAELGEMNLFLAGVLLTSGALFAVALYLLSRWVIASGCRPVEALAAGMAQLDASGPVPSSLQRALPREIEPFRTALLAFRERIDAAFEREKRVTSHLAHEIRTPIAELRTLTEVAQLWPEDTALLRSSMSEAHAIALQMERQVEACLRLARLQAGAEMLVPRDVDVGDLLRELCARLRALRIERGLEIEGAVNGPGVARADAALLELILANLLENACHHAPSRSRISWSLAETGSRLRVRIENPAPGLSPSDLEKAGEPFWRADEARAEGPHSGLGLATVKAAAQALGVELAFTLERGAFCAELLLRGASLAAEPVS